VQFKRPPVVEAWIEFRFALTDEVSAWDEEAARRLMREHYRGFNPDSFWKYAQVEVKIKQGKPDFADTKEFFDRIRAFSQEGDECIQASRDVFVFNQLKKDTWRGYEHMRDAAIHAVEKYMIFRGLEELTNVALHYRDVIAVPHESHSGIRLKDWFRIYPEVPEDPFRRMSGFRFTVQLPELCQGARANLSIQSVPTETQDDALVKFSIDWHVSSADKVKDMIGAKEWLDPVHDSLRNSFGRAFTPQCLELFEPQDGE